MSRDGALARQSTFAFLGIVLCALALFLVSINLGWVGYTGSDDYDYWKGGKGWLDHFPYVGELLASRETITVPLALSITLLGDNLFSLVVPTLLYALGLVLLVIAWIYSVSGARSAFAVAAILATSPILILWSTTASVDPIEAFFVLASVYLFYASITSGPSWRRLLGAGALAALGMLTRETSVFLLLTYGLLFLAGYGMPRKWYWAMAAGFVPVILAEMAYFWYATGNPLHRYTAAFHHDTDINRWIEQGSGTPIVHPVIDPFLMLIFSHYFGLLFWVGIPLSAWLLARRTADVQTRRLLTLLTALGATWFVAAGAPVGFLTLLPRYVTVTAVCASILTGLALASLWESGRRRLALLIGAALVGSNLISIDLDSKDQLFGAFTLTELTSPGGPTIHTDPGSVHRAEQLLKWKGTFEKVSEVPPRPGDLYFYDPVRANTPSRLMSAARIPDYQPRADWIVLERREPPPRGLRKILGLLINPDNLPPLLKRHFNKGHLGVTLYRVPG